MNSQKGEVVHVQANINKGDFIPTHSIVIK